MCVSQILPEQTLSRACSEPYPSVFLVEVLSGKIVYSGNEGHRGVNGVMNAQKFISIYASLESNHASLIEIHQWLLGT